MSFGRGVQAQARDLLPTREPLLAGIETRTAWRAATSASNDETDAVSVNIPSKSAGSPSMRRSQRHHDLLELGRGRRVLPEHHVGVESRGQPFSEDARCRRDAREVGHEPRMLPVGDVRLDQPE